MRSVLFILGLFASVLPNIFVGAKEDEKYPGFPEPLTKNNFKEVLSEGLHIVEFYSPYCSHCKHLEPVWKETWKQFQGESKTLNISFNQINCIESGDVCQDENIEAFPTIRLYNKDGIIKTYPGSGARTVESFLKFARKEAKNPNNFDDTSLDSKSTLLEDIDFIDMISGKAKEPMLVSFWPTESMVNVDSSTEFFDCEDCNAFQRTWKQLSNRLYHVGINSGHLNCVKYGTLCKQLGFGKLAKKNTFDDDRHPMVAMILPNKTTNNLFKYKGGYTTEPSVYENFAQSLFENSQLPEIKKDELKSIMKHEFDFDKDSFIPIDNQNIHIVFSYDPKTVVPEDYDIFEYLLEPLTKFPNIRLSQSKDDILGLVKEGYDEFYARINYNHSETQKLPNEEYITMATLTQSPTFVMFKDGELTPEVFHGYSTTEMRNLDLIMNWIKDNSLPVISKIDSSNIEKLVNFKPDLYNTLSILCVDLQDDPDAKEKKNIRDKERNLEKLVTGHYDFDNVRMNYMFEKILKRREKKDDIIKALKEKKVEAKKIVAAMRYEIFHEDSLHNLLGYLEVHDIQEVLDKLLTKPLERQLEDGDTIVIDKNNRKLYVTDVFGNVLKSKLPYYLRETLLSISMPEKAEFGPISESYPLKFTGKSHSKHSVLKTLFSIVVVITILFFVAPKLKIFYNRAKTNRAYKAKRNTVGLLGRMEKGDLQDKVK